MVTNKIGESSKQENDWELDVAMPDLEQTICTVTFPYLS